MGLTIGRKSRPVAAVLVAFILIIGMVLGLNSGLIACSTADKGARPLKAEEVNRLASMRMHNFSDARVAVLGTVGPQGRQTAVQGWIDWRRALIYLSVANGGSIALVQARPGILAVRPGHDQAGPPPIQVPSDGWRVRPLNLSEKEQVPLDNLVAFLFLLARDKPDNTETLQQMSTQWVRKDQAQGAEVDVLLGPAVPPEKLADPGAGPSASPSAGPSRPPPDPKSLDTYGGAVGYWLDAAGRLLKVETLLAKDMPTDIEFLRDDRQDFLAVAALGGRDIAPREITDAEAELLALMRQRNHRARYAEIKLTLPALPGTLRTASGWLDWQRSIFYLSLRDLDDSTKDRLVHATGKGISLRQADGGAPETPPVPIKNFGWETSTWSELSGTPNLTDLDVMLFETLSLALNQRDDVERMKAMARLLRFDMLDGAPMGVFELPNSIEQRWAAGTARLRYWVDNAGLLRRLEVRTQTGGFAQLDIKTISGGVPSLPASVQ